MRRARAGALDRRESRHCTGIARDRRSHSIATSTSTGCSTTSGSHRASRLRRCASSGCARSSYALRCRRDRTGSGRRYSEAWLRLARIGSADSGHTRQPHIMDVIRGLYCLFN
ncbi:hypothetical protein QAD02_004073, partial [Eretmocerus hayati]